MGETLGGLLALVAACAVWGAGPLFFRLLNHVPPVELFAHRVIWSLLFFLALAVARGRLGAALRLLARPTLARVLLAALALGFNWFVYLLAVQWGEVRQSSLGYYIYPLLSVALGVLFVGERMDRAQAAAVALAAAAVSLLALGAGAVPWIGLALAFSFAAYGFLKRTLVAGALASVTAETILLAPLALLWLAALHGGLVGGGGVGPGARFGAEAGTTVLLLLAGPVTAVPLVLFTYAARRLSMAAMGLGQYLSPTLQFVVAVVILGEPFGAVEATAFALIWTALALYSVAAARAGTAARRAAALPAHGPTGPR